MLLAVGWIFTHIILFYLLFTSGVLLEIFVILVKSILFNGGTAKGNPQDVFGWAGPLQAGLTATGTAGIPLGLAIFWRNRRKTLLRLFWIALAVGIGLDVYAVCMLFR
jgi:hypothetical protein